LFNENNGDEIALRINHPTNTQLKKRKEELSKKKMVEK